MGGVSQTDEGSHGSPCKGEAQGWSAIIQGINFDYHPKQVDNSGSATTVSLKEYLYNDVKHLFLSERWVII